MVWRKKLPKNGHKWRRRKKCFFTKAIHHVTSWSQRWQNYMNCTLNCFCTHPIHQIWPPVTAGCLQTSKECSRERDLAPMKKWYHKLRRVLSPKTSFYKKGIEALESVYHPWRRLCWWVKSNFASKAWDLLSDVLYIYI